MQAIPTSSTKMAILIFVFLCMFPDGALPEYSPPEIYVNKVNQFGRDLLQSGHAALCPRAFFSCRWLNRAPHNVFSSSSSASRLKASLSTVLVWRERGQTAPSQFQIPLFPTHQKSPNNCRRRVSLDLQLLRWIREADVQTGCHWMWAGGGGAINVTMWAVRLPSYLVSVLMKEMGSMTNKPYPNIPTNFRGLKHKNPGVLLLQLWVCQWNLFIRSGWEWRDSSGHMSKPLLCSLWSRQRSTFKPVWQIHSAFFRKIKAGL